MGKFWESHSSGSVCWSCSTDYLLNIIKAPCSVSLSNPEGCTSPVLQKIKGGRELRASFHGEVS